MRPFIYNLALSLGLKGQVYNDGIGVQISICGSAADYESFLSRLKKNPPPLARIDEIICENSSEIFDDFRILSSQQAQKIAPILSDFAICADCEAEFRDPKNRRYHHAFINCTHCGPRFSIISSLPYDRKNTSMTEFKMCASCEREYNDPLNRRFHAQPTCCPNCGPKAFLKDLKGQILAGGESAFSTCTELLEQGKIIAIKGLGGFHLCCDGSNVKAINELRKRKNRPAKPLAIMCENEQMASALADFSKGEKKLLNSQLRPIVLAKKSQVLKPKLSQAIAPNIDKIGVFLAPTSFNLLLFYYFKKPIIATSANLSGEPIITSSHELCAKLNSVADFVLDHNRQILNPSDDSVVFYSESLELAQYIRTSRGLRPSIVPFEIPNNISPNSRIPSENLLNSRISSENLLNSRIPSENSRIPTGNSRIPKVIITAGACYEMIDDVRAITNLSSGKMGLALAFAYYLRGFDVTLISSAQNLPKSMENLEFLSFKSSADLLEILKNKKLAKDDLLVMAAAISDYIPSQKAKGKIKKSGANLNLELKENIDILSSLKELKCKKIGFKMEMDEQSALSSAKNMLENKALDAVCLNVLKAQNYFGSEQNEVLFITKNSQKMLKMASKHEIAAQIVGLSENLSEDS